MAEGNDMDINETSFNHWKRQRITTESNEHDQGRNERLMAQSKWPKLPSQEQPRQPHKLVNSNFNEEQDEQNDNAEYEFHKLPVLIWSGSVALNRQDTLRLAADLEKVAPDPLLIRRAEKGGYLIIPRNQAQREAILKLTTLAGHAINAEVPKRYSETSGIIKGLHPDTDEDLLLSTLQRRYPTLQKAKLLTAKIHVPSKESHQKRWTALLTFSGVHLPEHVILGMGEVFRVNPYISKPLQCHRCQRFGHSESRCRRELRCQHCAGHHKYEKCPHQDSSPICGNCDGPHTVTYPSCPVRLHEQKIKNIMSSKDLPYHEARKECQSAAPSYASVTSKQTQSATPTTAPQDEGGRCLTTNRTENQTASDLSLDSLHNLILQVRNENNIAIRDLTHQLGQVVLNMEQKFTQFMFQISQLLTASNNSIAQQPQHSPTKHGENI